MNGATTALLRTGRVVLWLAAVTAIVAVAVMRCTRSGDGRFANPTKARVDSLLHHSVPATECVQYVGFTVYFSSKHHLPLCVTYELTQGELDGPAQRAEAFATDSTVAGCPLPGAYRGSGFHRGHMAPAADMHWSQVAMRQSFLMTNICPQHRSLNEGGWGRLEQKCREWVARDRALLIACGPIIDIGLDTIAGSGVTIPRQFYKVILAHHYNPPRALAMIYPNSPANGALRSYVTTIDEVERQTGIDFFDLLPESEQQQFETRSNLQQWLH